MERQTIAERIVLLVGILGFEVVHFAESLEINPGNIRNYKNNGNRPGSDLLEKIANTYPQVNLVWLLTGKEEPLLPERTPIDASTGSTHHTLQGCQLELDMVRREVEGLRDQLKTQEAIIATKDEMLSMLRGGYNRPN